MIFQLQRIDSNLFSINDLHRKDDLLHCCMLWTQKLRIWNLLRIVPKSRLCVYLFLPSPVWRQRKAALHPDGRRCENCSFHPLFHDHGWSWTSPPIPGETAKENAVLLEMFCTPQTGCLLLGISLKKKWTTLWVGYEFINNIKKKRSFWRAYYTNKGFQTIMFWCDFASNSVSLFPQCRKLLRRRTDMDQWPPTLAIWRWVQTWYNGGFWRKIHQVPRNYDSGGISWDQVPVRL